MTHFYKFEDMEVWKESRRLVRFIRNICKREHVKRDFAFIDQITRAVRSISHNIAEGSDAMTIPEFINFLGYAKRSSVETRSHLYDALEEEYISETEFYEIVTLTKKISGMLAKLIHHLQTLDPTLKRTFKKSINQLTN